jgi:hypothetical protein
MFVMHLVRFADRTDVEMIAARKQAETLVDNDFMHDEIRASIRRNADADEQQVKQFVVVGTEPDQEHGWHREDDKEPVVLFEESFSGPVMIFMQGPEKTVHHKPVRQPRESFHEAKCTDGNQRVDHA